MQYRTLTRPQQSPTEVDPHSLEAFQSDVIREIRELTDHTNRNNATISLLTAKLNHLDTMLTWIGTHRPEVIEDYKTTHDVINRLEDSHEMMEKEA